MDGLPNKAIQFEAFPLPLQSGHFLPLTYCIMPMPSSFTLTLFAGTFPVPKQFGHFLGLLTSPPYLSNKHGFSLSTLSLIMLVRRYETRAIALLSCFHVRYRVAMSITRVISFRVVAVVTLAACACRDVFCLFRFYHGAPFQPLGGQS